MNNAFTSLPLKAELIDNLTQLNFNQMTPIQEMSLPHILKGQDVIAQAKTGSGKTAAFGLGILNSIDTNQLELHALVLCPTRELANQVSEEIRRLSRSLKNIQIITLCGGSPESIQEDALLKNPQIAVGTPGRVLQLLKRNTLNLNKLKIFTLDEADRMLEMGFSEEIDEIITYLPYKRQSLLFSATYPEDIASLSQNIQSNAIEIKVDTAHESENIDQIFYEVQPTDDKNDFLFKVLSHFRPERMIVFCRTKKETDDVANFLIGRGIHAKSIHGDLEQNERTEVLTKFSNHSLSVLVATDVAARGLDIADLPAVFNYNLPSGADAYIHRIGRTGRAGKTGMAFSFFNPIESERLELIEALTLKKCKIEDITKITYAQKYDLIPPMQTIYISGGKKDKLRPGDIVGALTGEIGLKANEIGEISIQHAFSFVAIKRELVKKTIERLSSTKIKKMKFKVGLA
jgi:ATP-dependent RNA helicase DbpA